jgi:diacylglycerol kinase family enzyme
MAFMVEAVVLVNPASGTGTEISELEPVFPTCRVEPCSPEQLGERVRALRDAGVPFIGVAGGDGTLRTAAEVLVGGQALPSRSAVRSCSSRRRSTTSRGRARCAS